MIRSIRIAALAAAGATFAIPAPAQDDWATFAPGQDLGQSVHAPSDEVSFAWGDFDLDGDVDLAVAVKQAFTTPGKRANHLLMNEGGLLVDRTATLAAAADVAGDQGFLTPTNDRDIVAADVDLDGRLDLVTAVAVSPGDPKHVGHPRVYRNLGSVGGAYQGFRYESARIPQLFTVPAGLAVNPRFRSVAAGDVTGDGADDLYFVDHDSSTVPSGAVEPPGEDLNDRLLVNDGFGFFSDQSQLRMAPVMLLSGYATSCAITDVNQDGRADIVKNTTLGPQHVGIAYQDPQNPGTFAVYATVDEISPYHVSAGDLNNDGRPDLVVTTDGIDRYRLNTGNSPGGTATFSADHLLLGPGSGGDSVIVDLDGDGFRDVIVTDVDHDVTGFTRRTEIYHNLGGPFGSAVQLYPEREFSLPAQFQLGWFGVAGLAAPDLTGVHDVAPFDVDGDGDVDLVIGRGGAQAGLRVWENTAAQRVVCEPDAPIATSTGPVLSICSELGLATGSQAVFKVTGLAPLREYVLVGGGSLLGASLGGVGPGGAPLTLGPNPTFLTFAATGPSGTVVLPFAGGGGPGTFYVQVLGRESDLFSSGEGWRASNTVQMTLLP